MAIPFYPRFPAVIVQTGYIVTFSDCLLYANLEIIFLISWERNTGASSRPVLEGIEVKRRTWPTDTAGQAMAVPGVKTAHNGPAAPMFAPWAGGARTGRALERERAGGFTGHRGGLRAGAVAFLP